MAGDAHKYKFLNREFQPELGLNTIATDYRHYDAALGRFNNMDALSELAPSQTPYRYGFNNPVYWTDPTGLFESYGAAQTFALEELGAYSYQFNIIENEALGGFVLYVFGGEFSGTRWHDFARIDGEIEHLFMDRRTGGGGGGIRQNSSKVPSLWDRLGWGGMFNVWGVMSNAPMPKGRGRNSVEFSMDFDQVRGGQVSLRTNKNWWKNLKEWLSGMDSRTKTASSNSRVGEQTEQTSIEAHQEKTITIEYKKYSIWPDGQIRPHNRTQKTIPISEQDSYIKKMEEDSLRHLNNR